MLRNASATLAAATRRGSTRLARSRAASAARPVVTSKYPRPSTFSASRKSSTSTKQVHKSEKVTNDGETATRPPLLKPHVLAARLTKMCAEGKEDEAVNMLKALPLDAQNVVVWNTLIKYVGSQGRYKLAYSLHIDMKRRGIKPNMRSYATILGLYSKVTDWSTRVKLLQNAHKLYESYLEYLDIVKTANPTSPELSVGPMNAYLLILSKSGEWQKLFDVYNSLCEDQSPVSPDKITYSTIFKAFGERSLRARGEDPQSTSIRYRAASDARLVWRQMQKQIERGVDVQIDEYVIDLYIQPLSLGRPADQIIAFDVLRDYVGLAKPGETAPPATVTLSPILLADAFWLCNLSKKYRLCVHWAQQLMEKNPTVLDRRHMDHVLAAYSNLSAIGSLSEASFAMDILEWMIQSEASGVHDARIRPMLSTYTLVLNACWRGKAWDSTLRTFELMTGYRAEDFADGAEGEPQKLQRSRGRNILPDAAAMACIIRTAHATGDHANMRQCLRIVRHIGLKQLLQGSEEETRYRARNASSFQSQSEAHFYAHKTASALVDLVNELVPRKAEGEERSPLSPQDREWVAVRSEARSFLVAQRDQRPQKTPQYEEQPLGSDDGLAAVDSAVQWARISRESKSPKNR